MARFRRCRSFWMRQRSRQCHPFTHGLVRRGKFHGVSGRHSPRSQSPAIRFSSQDVGHADTSAKLSLCTNDLRSVSHALEDKEVFPLKKASLLALLLSAHRCCIHEVMTRGYDSPELFREDPLFRIGRLECEINDCAKRMNKIIRQENLPGELVGLPFPDRVQRRGLQASYYGRCLVARLPLPPQTKPNPMFAT